MDIKNELILTAKAVHKELLTLFSEYKVTGDQLGSFGKIFYDQFDDYLINSGKRIRPFLVKTAFEAVNGNQKSGNIVKASLAIELLHTGSLLHDDVIDKDETRRGKPSFHVIFREIYSKKKKASIEKATDFGEAIAIFAGDLCFPFAIESLNQSGFPSELIIKALHAFSEGFREVIDGVILETGDAILNEGNEETYLKMINFKTGALIRKAVEIGTILGKGNNSQLKALTDYCDGIGMAFQIQDDLLGVFGNPEELGKPVGSDIRENKNTILKIHAMTHGSEKDIQRLNELLGKIDINEKELQEAQKIFTSTGAVDRALKMISNATEGAIKALDTAKPPLMENPKNLLTSLAKFLVERKK